MVIYIKISKVRTKDGTKHFLDNQGHTKYIIMKLQRKANNNNNTFCLASQRNINHIIVTISQN